MTVIAMPSKSVDPTPPTSIPPDPRRAFFSFFKTFNFPGGEPHVQFEFEKYDAAWFMYRAWCETHGVDSTHLDRKFPERTKVTLRTGHPNGVFNAVLLADAARRLGVDWIGIKILYMPFGRQDRITNDGEALGIKFVADVLNKSFDNIMVLDPHSDVTTALLRNPMVITQAEAMVGIGKALVREEVALNPFLDPKTVLVCPDMGARKKIDHVARALGGRQVIYCDKKRDTKTGKLSGFHVNTTNEVISEDANFMIVDDLIDGGGTFLGIREILEDIRNNDVFLAASFGIFSKGTRELADAFDHIYVAETATFERTFSPSFTNAKAFSK